MNPVSNSGNDFIQESAEGSDSDANDDDFPEYYQPISAGDDHDEDVSDPTSSDGNSDDESEFPRLANGYADRIGNGISSVALSDDEERKSNEEEEEAGEEEGTRVASDSAMLRPFREDESRRNAPLTPEAATRVMEAMRGVSFNGFTPIWAHQVPEDQWINQLRRLRQPQDTIHD
ncbi:hypothetical protein U1Q18_020698 [Sarracenia purpurea var. burkii]